MKGSIQNDVNGIVDFFKFTNSFCKVFNLFAESGWPTGNATVPIALEKTAKKEISHAHQNLLVKSALHKVAQFFRMTRIW